jgi:hypothetical protein
LHLDQVARLHVPQVIKDRRTAGRIKVAKNLGSSSIAGTVSPRVPGHFIQAIWRFDIGRLRHGNAFDFRDN